MFDKLKRLIARHTICKMMGHISTSGMLSWMCDRCFCDFAEEALPSEWVGITKITRSKPA